MESGDSVDLPLRLATAAGPIDVQLRVPRGPVRLSVLAAFAQQLTDLIVDRAIRAERDRGRELSCRAGCGACCRQLVPLSAPEVFALADHAVRLEPKERDALFARYERLGQTLTQAGTMALLEELRRGEHRDCASDVAKRYFASSAPCPFLVADSCSVHPQRPLICRLYNVTSPAEWCAEPARHRIVHVPTPPSLGPALAELTADLCGGAAELVPLPLALDWAEQHAELAMQTWPGIDLVRDLMARLARTA